MQGDILVRGVFISESRPTASSVCKIAAGGVRRVGREASPDGTIGLQHIEDTQSDTPPYTYFKILKFRHPHIAIQKAVYLRVLLSEACR